LDEEGQNKGKALQADGSHLKGQDHAGGWPRLSTPKYDEDCRNSRSRREHYQGRGNGGIANHYNMAIYSPTALFPTTKIPNVCCTVLVQRAIQSKWAGFGIWKSTICGDPQLAPPEVSVLLGAGSAGCDCAFSAGQTYNYLLNIPWHEKFGRDT